jgi:hypothetical protein
MARVDPSVRSGPQVAENFGEKVKAHTRYRKRDGTLVPSATAVIGQLAKGPALTTWANRLGLAGIDSSKYLEEAAASGTAAHLLIASELKVETPDLRDFTANQMERARASLGVYQQWRAGHDLNPVLVETPLVSEALGYGGTVDLLAALDGKPTLLDFKTSNSIHLAYEVQVAAYWRLLTENGYPVDHARILRLGRGADSAVEERIVTRERARLLFGVFRAALDIHRLFAELAA